MTAAERLALRSVTAQRSARSVCFESLSPASSSEKWQIAVNHPLAYLDPGSGSLLVQGLVAGVASAVVMAKVSCRTGQQFMGFGRDESIDE